MTNKQPSKNKEEELISKDKEIADLVAKNKELEQEIHLVLEQMKAVNNPVTINRKGAYEPLQNAVGQDLSFCFKKDGGIEKSRIQDVESPEFKAKMEEEAFMNEKIKIRIHSTSNEYDDPVFRVWCNGKKFDFQRDEDYLVPRYFVEVLARCKKTTYRSKKRPGWESNAYGDGNDLYHYPAKTGLRYPFSILEDNNPRGKQWITRILKEL